MRGKGCLKFGLIGCGVLGVLFVAAVVVAGLWFKRNEGVLAGGAQEGARFGLVRDENACFQEAQRRAAEATTVAATVGVGPFMRSCLEYSKPTQGFCGNVPPPTSIGRTAAWQSQRCGDNVYCKSVIQVVQTYCIEGRPKRQAADTLLMQGGGGDAADAGAQGDAGAAGIDSTAVAAEADSSSF
jgi:hypothetical protein